MGRSLLALLACASFAAGADWPQWRGINRDGNSAETGLLKEWPKGGPPLAWQSKGGGRGYSSIAIAAGKVYTVGDGPSTEESKDEYLICLNESDGKRVWQVKLGSPYINRNDSWGSSRSTPTIDGEYLYVITGSKDVACLKTSDGSEVWRKGLEKDFGGKKGDSWSYSESVLIDGDHAICSPGGKSAMVALDKKTGKTVWTATLPGNPGAGHSSVMPSTVGKTRVLVQTCGGNQSKTGFGFGVRASDGKVLWTVPNFNATAVIPTPVILGEYALIAKGYGGGGILLKQAEGDDGVSAEKVYPINSGMSNKHGGIVRVGEYVYGDTEDAGSPFCAEWKTGKQRWKGRTTGRSISLCAADGHLYMHSADGTMSLVPAAPEGFKVVGSFKLPGSGGRPGWSHPAIANGKLFVREGDAILCYDIKAK